MKGGTQFQSESGRNPATKKSHESIKPAARALRDHLLFLHNIAQLHRAFTAQRRLGSVVHKVGLRREYARHHVDGYYLHAGAGGCLLGVHCNCDAGNVGFLANAA